MLEQLREVIELAAKFIPRVEVVNTKQAGVAWVRGKPREVRPGRLFIYWPLWTEVEWVDVQPQATELSVQAIGAGRGQALAISASVVWKITHPRAAICNVDDIRDYVTTMAQCAVRNATYGKSVTEIRDHEGKVEQEMANDLQIALSGLGVRVDRMFFVSHAPAKVLVHMGDLSAPAVQSGAEEVG